MMRPLQPVVPPMKQLNSRQHQAVRYIDGPLLVLAGAGSGKTSVITQKIAWLINECGYKPHHIAAVTFTNKAAREMRERVSQLLKGTGSKGLIISTFHHLGLTIIRRECSHLGLKSSFTIFDDQDCLSLLRELTHRDGEADEDQLKKIVSVISQWKNQFLTPGQCAGLATTPDEVLAAKLYETYQRH